MKSLIYVTVILTVLYAISLATAQNRVVVIPLVETIQKPTTCTGPNEIISAGGRCWMDRNLGAGRVATSVIDGLAFGDYFQWGRLSDGHQYPASQTTAAISTKDVPRHSQFITSIVAPHNWISPPNGDLWQGLYGTNNPCPQGFRIPTKAEWEYEIASWSSQSAAGAFASPLKLTLAGSRSPTDGTIINKTSSGHYWSSNVKATTGESFKLGFGGSYANMYNSDRATGNSVRCIKD